MENQESRGRKEVGPYDGLRKSLSSLLKVKLAAETLTLRTQAKVFPGFAQRLRKPFNYPQE